MENLAERQTLYQEILNDSFDQIARQLPKNQKNIVQQFVDQLKEDTELNANKYFAIYKVALTSKDPKLISISLDALDKLINTGFVDGNCEETIVPIDLSDKSPNNGQVKDSKRKLIDVIIEVVCACKREKNEEIYLQLINVLTIIATKLKQIVHGSNLQKIVETLTAIYTVSKSQANQNSAKTSLKLVVTTVFQIVDKDKKGEVPVDMSFIDAGRNVSQRISPDTTTNHAAQNIQEPDDILVKETNKESEETKPEEKSEKTEDTRDGETKEKVNETASQKEALFKNYMGRFVKNLVDDICIYNAKVDAIVEKYQEKEEAEREAMPQEIKEVPIKAIPLANDVDNPKYKVLKKAKVENEEGTPAGVFGWCFICRGTAGLFCKDTRVPVCSLECKFKHLEEADFLSNKGDNYNPKSLESVQDAYQVFGYLCRISNKEQGKDNPQELLRTKALALELLLTAMANPSAIFSSRKEFRDSIREYLCSSVLKNSLSTDRTIFSYSLGIFNSLVNHFREFLKPEMVLFIEKIFFNMLESANSTYNHRMSALQVFYKICSKANIVLDFYVNYDCDMESTNIVEKMVELLCKIAQGKYSKPEYAPVVQPAQDQNLRFIALGALVNLVKALVLFTEDYNKQIVTNDPLRSTPVEETKEEDDREPVGEAELIRNVAFDKLDEIGRSRWFKNELQKAIQKFNFKIKTGMKYFSQLGVLKPDDAKSVAKFFKKTPNLSKEKLGEYFGEEAEFHVKVLTEFTDLLDFRNKTLDDALRVFLEYFVLPGEGQKIDRIVQVFAGKFFKDNQKSYNSATAAYTLSFLFIMLQTDAHNPNIKPEEKMKLNNFINLARGINDGKDLPPEELTGYYNRILQHPLALHEADRAKKMIADAQGVSARKKEEQFKLESDKMIKEGQKLIRGQQSGYYHIVRNTDCIKPLFHEVVWSPVLAVFSVLLEQSEDPNMVQSCLEGFANCIILTGLHNLSMERDTFVSSLAKFTNILTVREIKEKNIKCIKLLLDLAANRGHLLRSSWRFVLECIIWIEYYFHYSPHTHTNRAGDVSNKSKAQSNEALEQIEHMNSEIIQQIVDLNLVNVIFSKSSTFDIEEVMDFITCLCEISKEELRTKGTNIYCLQKLVEVAHFNMDGIKFIWAKIWNIMREHLSYVALNSKPEVSLFAIDSLKQLSIKFLSKKELGLLEFQKDFLKPFETIFQRTKGEDTKELILGCCNYIILHTRKDLKSGWKTIIDILGLTADSEDGHLIKMAFSITESILQEDVKSLRDLVGDFTILLLKFAKSKKSDIAEVSLRHLKTFLQQIIIPDTVTDTTKSPEPREDLEPTDQNVTTMEEQTLEQNIPIHGLHENTWITILTSIITLASDSSAKIQTQSTMLLFDLLDQYGAGFPNNFWGMVLSGVIKPLFDEIQYSLPSGSSRNAERSGAFKEFYGKAFERFIDLFSIFFDKLSQFNEELFNILLNCVQNQSQIISRVGINALRYMIFKDTSLRRRGLDLVFELYRRLCANTPLAQALNIDTVETKTEGEPEVEREVKNVEIKKDMGVVEYEGVKLVAMDCDVQCKVQLLLVRIIRDTLDQFFGGFEDQQINQLRNILQSIYKLARKFNEQTYLRYGLSKCGFMKDREDKAELPDLLEQEHEAMTSYSMILFRLYNERKEMEQEKALGEFLDMGVHLIKSFKSRNEELLNLSKKENRKMEGAEAPEEVEERKPSDEVEGRLKKNSLEKEILVLREILYSEFLAKLVKVEPREMKHRLKEVTKAIIDGVICFVPKESEDYTEVLRTILNRYFAFCYDRVEE